MRTTEEVGHDMGRIERTVTRLESTTAILLAVHLVERGHAANVREGVRMVRDDLDTVAALLSGLTGEEPSE